MNARVYPRVCGGTCRGPAGAPYGRGLSPRVRGNRGALNRSLSSLGSIPACAGEPSVRSTYACIMMVYPRVCGGTCVHSRQAGLCQGLSPRVRGNLRSLKAGRAVPRSIPACAGEPGAVDNVCVMSWVYPRVCGGTRGDHQRSPFHRGLSPRVRGNPTAVTYGANTGRSIPACAGEPIAVVSLYGQLEVYPRVCGGTGMRPASPT